MSAGYNVVFEYTNKAGAYEGAKYWTFYDSEIDFRENYLPRILSEGERKVVAEGVSEDEAVRLSAQMDRSVLVNIAIDEATLKNEPLVGGKRQLIWLVLQMHLMNHGLELTDEGERFVRENFHVLE